MKKLSLLTILIATFSFVGTAQETESKVNKSISINIDGEETVVNIEEEVDGNVTTIHLEGEEAEAWIESNQTGYSYAYGTNCSSKHISKRDKEEIKKELRQVGVELEEGLDDISKYIDEIDVESLVDEIQKSVDAIQKEIEINIRTSSDDDRAVI
ncbi:MAG: hypothetical protein HN542_00940 [Flavobacteriales bacterium]|jgi:frataxin-like iron-binding protein CyaY|nr:hypothetical protein [Flavobacteriales bacterium]NCG30040.1 hypothetical protein [Bacteroidota bacterium]MBT3963528.1 hypothetical protein [Flavobacteriales bacterium]MBT4706252.1 hypothetical protein [Flavobacteriales bacterium]MBT4931427.1 hypothetical protein [Flavobacteriales bacterium]